ncbi:MAG: ATP-binding protein [bacterium]|nr:ATP-binding protein [bacterium]
MDSSGETASGLGVVRLEALRYRSLRYVSQELGAFHVLVGPNASGKSNFLDVVAFLGDLSVTDLITAFRGDSRVGMPLRATDGRHLVWMNRGDSFELAVEMAIPDELRFRLGNGDYSACRYEVAVDVSRAPRLTAETLWLRTAGGARPVEAPQRSLFPETVEPPASIVRAPRARAPNGWRKVVSRGETPEQVMFQSETTKWRSPFRLGVEESALAALPADRERFPVAVWFREALRGVRRIVLSSEGMRRPCPPLRQREYLPDGSNLPHVIHGLERDHPESHERWIRHISEALPDVVGITTREREEDRHRYLVLRYAGGLEAPSWLVSDGTLRLLALTLLAYVPDLAGLFLIEEPENGVHPRALETAIQSLSSVYGAQVLLATHSPLVVRLADREQLLCLARTNEGGTDVVAGTDHPALRDWQGTADLGTLLASGILG